MVNGTEVNAIVEDRAQAEFLTEMHRPLVRSGDCDVIGRTASTGLTYG